MPEVLWIFSYCEKNGTKEYTHELKLFKTVVDDFLCTVKVSP